MRYSKEDLPIVHKEIPDRISWIIDNLEELESQGEKITMRLVKDNIDALFDSTFMERLKLDIRILIYGHFKS